MGAQPEEAQSRGGRHDVAEDGQAFLQHRHRPCRSRLERDRGNRGGIPHRRHGLAAPAGNASGPCGLFARRGRIGAQGHRGRAVPQRRHGGRKPLAPHGIFRRAHAVSGDGQLRRALPGRYRAARGVRGHALRQGHPRPPHREEDARCVRLPGGAQAAHRHPVAQLRGGARGRRVPRVRGIAPLARRRAAR